MRVLVTVFTISMLLFGSNAWADPKEDFNRWQNTLAPLYLRGVSMSGNIASGPISAPFELDFSDAVSAIEGIFTIHYEGVKGNWGIISGVECIRRI